ncbi:MAG: ATP-grasp domain-containing protein [Planctomycetaceae bacterium]
MRSIRDMGFCRSNPVGMGVRAGGYCVRRPLDILVGAYWATKRPRLLAAEAGVPVLAGSGEAIPDAQTGLRQAKQMGFPVILKAAKGGGGRGMRVVTSPEEFITAFESAQHESKTAFGSSDVFIEKFIERARHIEVQILGDSHGNLTHLFERDCSVQRRHQKVVEMAPAPNLSAERQKLLESALAIGKVVNYLAAGTVEFLVDAKTEAVYFIEANPRIQGEHTVTEEVTGVDIRRLKFWFLRDIV